MKAKRILSVLLSLIMVLSISSPIYFADETDFISNSENEKIEENVIGDDNFLEEEYIIDREDQGENQTAPTSISIEADTDNLAVLNDVIYAKKGDIIKLVAYDENGAVTPVTWENTSYGGGGVKLNEETGEFEIENDLYSGGTSYLYFKAASTIDPEIKSKEKRISITGYKLSKYYKEATVTLSADGQTVKNYSLSAGVAEHNIWSYNIQDDIAKLSSDPGKGKTIKFTALRPGTFTVTFTVDMGENVSDTATVQIKGVAVEDSNGNNGKTYLGIKTDNTNPTVQLRAFTESDRSVSKWSSSDESIATVDENGLVTAKSVGNVIITAEDSEGTKGGIKVVCKSEEVPYFENLQFYSNAIKDYAKTYNFAPTVTDYTLNISQYATSTLTIQNTTVYDEERFSAYAEYTDLQGEKCKIDISSEEVTSLPNIPFEESKIVITIYDRENKDNKTVYNFNVTRPRDTTNTIKATTGFVLIPDGRVLSGNKYNGFAEGTMFKLNDDGEFKISYGTTLATGVTANHYFYKCFIYENPEKCLVQINGNTAYEHLRYSTDGENWINLPQGGGFSNELVFKGQSIELTVQIVDDASYVASIKEGKDGFEDCTPKEYKLIIEKIGSSDLFANIITATTESGNWYPCAFKSNVNTYAIEVPKTVTSLEMKYTVPEGVTVKIGNSVQTPTDGVYTVSLKTIQQSIILTSADGKTSVTYNFKLLHRSEGYPDKLVDFMCIDSQYINGKGAGNAASHWNSLAGSFSSLGNFGGYVTYYYDEPLTDNPNNKYGIDFYVYGNANKDTTTSTKTSFFEPAQAYVSEDGEKWYALAGSAHYDDGVEWNYTVNYKREANGYTSWTDNKGNSYCGTKYASLWPSSDIYAMNDLAKSDTISFSGVALPARNGKIAVWGEAVDAYPISWGYADCFQNGTKGVDVNPYVDNSDFSVSANGFDLQWAVDENGLPIDVSNKEFHYVKMVTASNIWHSSFLDKSAEIAGVVRTKAQSEEVGKTEAPSGVTITDGAESKIVNFKEDVFVYSINIDDLKYVSICVNDAAEDDNIYINNTRVSGDEFADGFKITKESGEKLVRIVVQNGDKEPLIYILKISGNATESDDIIEGIKIDANGTSRACTTKNGTDYSAQVGYRISSVGIYPVADSDVKITINGEEIKGKYRLSTGDNVFTITGKKDGKTKTVTLKIEKENAPASTGKINVYFTLLGDDEHGENGKVHTLKNGGLDTWIEKTAIEIDSPATILDVFEKALEGKYTFVNADGNYISEIGDLAEFSNGPLSGWMYTLNGKHPTKGLAEQSVKNGDKIVFHYTDDYTLEEGSEKWNSSSGGSASVKSFTVKFETNGGTAVKSQTVDVNSAVTKPENPTKDGYVFAGWFTDKNFKSEYDFSRKISGSFTLYAKWITEDESVSQNPNGDDKDGFSDVMNGDWFKSAVDFVLENNLFTGTSNKIFAPNGVMTRAMLVVVLYRLDKADKTNCGVKFIDVDYDSWYGDAVDWALKNGIINGISEKEFAPNESVTREQLALILYRYAKTKSYGVSEISDLIGFIDETDSSNWAVEALKWACGKQLICGNDKNEILPKSFATRAEVAAILMRFCLNCIK